MARFVPYERQTLSSTNPAVRYAHRSRVSRALRLTDSHLAENGTLIDFGAGSGLFLSELKKRKPRANLLGIDPYKKPAFPEITYVESLASINDHTADVVTAFEVCEHLTERELEDFLDGADRVLTDSGLLIISVPIMDGPVVIAKEVSHMLLRHRRCQYTAKEFCRVVLGLPIKRPQDPRHSHKGFNFRALNAQFRGASCQSRSLGRHFQTCLGRLIHKCFWWPRESRPSEAQRMRLPIYS
jgi:2-polyprenyl-3-methyl-5-hydroxy-6-metoxy-1,4-benzoquinol methylase